MRANLKYIVPLVLLLPLLIAFSLLMNRPAAEIGPWKMYRKVVQGVPVCSLATGIAGGGGVSDPFAPHLWISYSVHHDTVFVATVRKMKPDTVARLHAGTQDFDLMQHDVVATATEFQDDQIIDALSKAPTMTFQGTALDGQPLAYSFDIAGLGQAWQAAQDACRPSPKKS